MFIFSPNGNQNFVHPERNDFDNHHHYSISSQNPLPLKQDETNEINNTPLSASKVKWFDAVRTVKQLNQVRLVLFLYLVS